MRRPAATHFGLLHCKHGALGPRLKCGKCRCDQCREESNARTRKWQAKNKDKTIAWAVAWQKANPDRRKLNAARAGKVRKQNGKDVAYRTSRASEFLARNQKRRASKKASTPLWNAEFDRFVFVEAARLCKQRQLITGIKWQLDHMIPLQATEVCGLHVANNLAVIPAQLNTAKGNRMLMTEPGDWLRTPDQLRACQAIVTSDRANQTEPKDK